MYIFSTVGLITALNVVLSANVIFRVCILYLIINQFLNWLRIISIIVSLQLMQLIISVLDTSHTVYKEMYINIPNYLIS